MQQQQNGPSRRKRVSNACQRCRQHKIKCSGSRPCKTCTDRGCRCFFVSDDRNILVSERSLANLRKRVEYFEKNQQQNLNPSINSFAGADASSSTSCHPNPSFPLQPNNKSRESSIIFAQEQPSSQASDSLVDSTVVTNQNEPSPEKVSQEDTDVPNLLVSKQPNYMSDYSGRLRYLGHTSTWSFSYQVLQMASQSAGINTSPAASTQSHVDGQLYSIIPELQIGLDAAEISNLPALELALYYAQTAKFRTYPLYHLFEETDFSQNLHCFYQDPSDYAQTHGLWYVHYLVIMALGKSLLGKQAGMRPAGSELFSRALNLLPDAAYLSRDPVRATELFCSVALYLHCVDHRVAAHSYIGQAVRMAQSHGLHTDMPPALVGDRLAQHGRLLWWTAYTLDRRLSSLMGTPNTIHNEDISAPLPRISDSDLHSAALSIHVKLAKTLGSISITVYGPKEKLKDTFLSTIRRTLKCIGELGDELASFSSRSIGEISRVAAHLNLQYNQCIVLTTRPVLFHLYKQRLDSSPSSGEFLIPSSIKELIQALTDSAVQIANILLQLKKFNLLDDFLPFDLETAYSAAFVLIMSSEIEAKHPLHEASLAALLDVFDTMVAGGNLVASSRKAEVEELDYSLRKQFCQITNDNANSARALPSDEGPDASLAGQLSLPSPSGSLFEGWSPGNLYTGSRIEGLADSLTMDELNDLWV